MIRLLLLPFLAIALLQPILAQEKASAPAAPKVATEEDKRQRQPGPYKPGPDSEVKPGVPQGKVTKYEWATSKIFPDTKRDYWVYVPAQYDGTKPACVLVFQDGGGCINPTGALRVPTVMDNLIAAKEMPVTIGIFINPGSKLTQKPGEKASNRSFEYDTLSADYSKFLLDEILPEVGKNYKLTNDPEGRAIAGGSSGGICAFTVAWQRPDAFRKVFTWIGSFTNIRGGNAYPEIVKKETKKPIRIFQQDGSNDLINQFGSWFDANKAMEAVWKEKGYDLKTVYGTGGHNPAHAGQLLPDVLRWLWRDYKAK
jgi:enterochelin esterase-like enzyme